MHQHRTLADKVGMIILNLQVINLNRRLQNLMLNKLNNYIFAVRKYQYIAGTKLCGSCPAKLVDIERMGRCLDNILTAYMDMNQFFCLIFVSFS